MTLFVYVTQHCLDDARRHGVMDAVECLRTNLDAKQSLSQFDPSPLRGDDEEN